MSRLSIELTAEQHHRLKAMAALQGKSIKDYVLERALPDVHSGDVAEEEEALHLLELLLKPRVEAADRGDLSPRTTHQIFGDVRRGLN